MSEKEPLLSWTFPEFTPHQRGRSWYLGFFAAVITITAIAFWSKNYTFIAVIILATFVLILRFRKEPMEITIDITERGVVVAGRVYAWSELKEFWIVYKPPQVKQLYLNFKRPIRPEMNIGLVNQNPLKVREILREYILENIEREEEPASEILSRYFKV